MSINRITKSCIQAFVLGLLLMQAAFAESVTIIGSIPQQIKQNTLNSLFNNKAAAKGERNDKTIQLLRVQLSDDMKKIIIGRAHTAFDHSPQFPLTAVQVNSPALPETVQLGMKNVPVLDQGYLGTCTTFAVTAALDVSIGKGDYISQLCNLQLGTYLEHHGYSVSGWEGAYTINVLNQIAQFGIVSKDKQRTKGCGGMTAYPYFFRPKPDSFIEPEHFRSMSELLFGTVVNWSDVYQGNNPETTLNNVKEALNSGDRLVMSVLLPRTDLGNAGAVGSHNTWLDRDTWVLTAEIIDDIQNAHAAHALIITGYDDNATAVDYRGKHKGLLILRNSWGSMVGDWGEFYMSYDYFKVLAFDVKRFSPN